MLPNIEIAVGIYQCIISNRKSTTLNFYMETDFLFKKKKEYNIEMDYLFVLLFCPS
jgi:hypothetical protein